MNKIKPHNQQTFSSFASMEEVQWVLAMAAVNEHLRSVLIVGSCGSGKTEVVRAWQNVLRYKRIIKIPLNATDEALLGTLDVQATLRNGYNCYQPGWLKALDGQVLFIDNINLLSEAIVHRLLLIQEVGYYLAPDGSVQPCRMTIVATMNPDEGAISSHTLDRFDLYVEVQQRRSLNNRLEILQDHQLNNTNSFIDTQEDEQWHERIHWAHEHWHQMQLYPSDLQTVANACIEAYISGHRGDLALIEGAKAYAALHHRTTIELNDIQTVQRWTLNHRTRSPKQAEEQPNNDPQPQSDPNEAPEQEPATSDDRPQSTNDQWQDFDVSSQTDNNQSDSNSSNSPEDEQFDISPLPFNTQILSQERFTNSKRNGNGKRLKNKRTEGKGRQIRSISTDRIETDSIDLNATIRAAAPYQSLRPKGHLAINITPLDWQRKVKERRIGHAILFLIDASGSMGVKQRMSEAKGSVFALLNDAYVHRDSVGMITFRKESAELLLPLTRSVNHAHQLLQKIKTGGRTPLWQGLNAALDCLVGLQRKDAEQEPILIIFSDGKATSTYTGENNDETLQTIAQKLANLSVRILMIDTETGFVRLGKAKQLAHWLSAEYYKIDELKEQSIKSMIYK